MSKTKIVGCLMVAAAALNLAIDVLNGGGIDFQRHFETISTALAGAGFVYLRGAVGKVQDAQVAK